MKGLIERKQIVLHGKRFWAEVPKKLTASEREETLERLYRNIAKIAERQKSS